MSKTKVLRKTEILEDLESQLRALKRKEEMMGPNFGTRHEIGRLEGKIAAIKEQLFYDTHPELQRYRRVFGVLPLAAAGILLIIFALLTNILLEMSGMLTTISAISYRVITIVVCVVVLHQIARYDYDSRIASITVLKLELFTHNERILEEIENSISELEAFQNGAS